MPRNSTTSTSTTVVLLGGGGLGPWAWDRVVPLLEQQGLAVRRPRLRTTGGDPTPPAEVTLGDWVDDLLADLELLGGDAVLVAHSFAGYVAGGVIERAPELLRSVVLLDAAVPQAGRSWFDAMGAQVEGFMRSLAVDGATPWFTPDQLDQVYPGHGLEPDDLAWMRPLLSDQPVGTYTEAPVEGDLAGAALPISYVRCSRTTPAMADVPAGWPVRTLDAGHWPMITVPGPTAEVLTELVG